MRWPKSPTEADPGVTIRLGIVGGGQLGRMIALSAAPLGVECRFIDPSPEAGARVAAEQLVAAYDDEQALAELAEWSDVITFEFENVPSAALDSIAGLAELAPSPRSLEVGQDRLSEKRMFERLGFGVADYRPVESLDELEIAFGSLAGPAILKTRRLGYDGKGQVRVAGVSELADAWTQVGSVPCVLERMVDFDCEISAIVVRAKNGETVSYPAAENVHRDGILETSVAPATVPEGLRERAAQCAVAIAEELGHVGALAVEFLVAGDQLLINEIAPRVHNSGHWTLDGSGCSQFENHVRAVVGLPLGAVEPARTTTMVNLVGGLPAAAELLAPPGTHLHDYAKAARPGRKLGHVNVVAAEDADEYDRACAQVLALARAAWA